MQLRRRQFLHLAAGAAALPARFRASQEARLYPSRTGAQSSVGFFPPRAGGTTLVAAALIGASLSGAARASHSVIENDRARSANIAQAVVPAAPPYAIRFPINLALPVFCHLRDALTTISVFNLIP